MSLFHTIDAQSSSLHSPHSSSSLNTPPLPSRSPSPPLIRSAESSPWGSGNNSPVNNSFSPAAITSTVASTMISSSSSSVHNSDGLRNRHFTQVIDPKDDKTNEITSLKNELAKVKEQNALLECQKERLATCCALWFCCSCSCLAVSSYMLHTVQSSFPSMDRY